MKPQRVRLFFALWPPEEVRQALWRSGAPLREACRGQPVAKRNLHLTLLFLGGVDEDRLEDIEADAAGVSVQPFSPRPGGRRVGRGAFREHGETGLPAGTKTVLAPFDGAQEMSGWLAS